jgi:hypothetical protein
MEVLILHIDWFLDLPIATVAAAAQVPFRLSLLHRSFVQRYHITLDTRLCLSTTRFIQKVFVADTVGYYIPTPTQTVFDRWFLLRRQLKPFLSPRVCLLLFTHGLETIDDIGRYQSFSQIHGIGPVMSRKIHAMCSTLHLDANDLIK